MNLKPGPIIFLLTLAIILVFILGVRYGQKVEKTNKVINYLISLPPTKPPGPTQKPLEFKEYMNKACGIKFLYPSFLTVSEGTDTIATKSGEVILKSQVSFMGMLIFDCEKNDLFSFVFDKKQKRDSVDLEFKNQKIVALKSGTNTYHFEFVNNLNGKTIHVSIDNNLYPLFESSLKFLP